MSDYFQLTKSVRITSNIPIDGDRYVVGDISQRNHIIDEDRAFEGLQVYVSGDTALNNGLWILTGSTAADWKKIEGITQSDIISSNNQIIFNSGGTLVGDDNLLYDHENSIFSVKDDKSEFLIRPSSYYTPTLQLNSNYVDGIDISISHSNTAFTGILETNRSLGTQSSKTNIDSATLFTYNHNGYFDTEINSAVTSYEAEISAKEWSENSFTTTYKISTISSGDTLLEERFLIDGDGAIKFNNAYIFPQNSGTSNQVLTQSGNGYLYWSDIVSNNSLSGLTDTIITNPQEGDKLIYSGNSWVNVVDADTIYEENIGSGGTFTFIISNVYENNAMFIHFMNYQDSNVFQMGELQLLHNGLTGSSAKVQLTTNGQDLDLYVKYKASINATNVELICEVPNVSGDVVMRYTKEIL